MKFIPLRNVVQFIFLLTDIQILYCYVFNGFQIQDLTSTDSSFSQESSAWTATRVRSTPIYTICQGTYLLGGYNVLGVSSGSTGDYFERIYTGLPPHAGIRYSFTFWILDSWDTKKTDSFQIQFDSKTLNGWKMDYKDFPVDLCGSNTNDLAPFRVFGTVSHSASTLTLRLISQLDQSPQKESFGVRDINLIFFNASGTVTDSICGKTSIALSTQECACSEGTYESPVGSGTCLACHSSCSSCFGSLSTQCYQCASGRFFNGSECVTCDSSCSICYGTGSNQCKTCKYGYFLYNNNTCLSSCNSPLVQTSDGKNIFCQTPCDLSQYIYPNGTCSSTCDSPFLPNTKDGFKFCESPCDVSKIIYQNGTCSTFCDSPLTVTTKYGYQFCRSPCDDINKFIYQNEVCSTSCNSPYIQSTKDGFKMCNSPCNTSSFTYENGDCSLACDPPLDQVVKSGLKFCQSPCDDINKFIYQNGDCSYSCDPLFTQSTINGLKFCNSPCTPSEFVYQDGTCSTSCSSPLNQVTKYGSKFCESPCDDINKFIYQNGYCSYSCDALFTQSTTGWLKFCDSPCASSEFVYQNGACLTSCSSPLNQITKYGSKFCESPCDDINKFIYDNRQCSTSCSFPFTQGTHDGLKFCHSPCGTSQFVYRSGACFSDCDLPLTQTTQQGYKVCINPCNDNEFVYWNSSCKSSCSRMADSIKYCDFPCTAFEYLLWNGSCISSCDFPMTIQVVNNKKSCNLPCSNSSDYYYEEDKSCRSYCNLPDIVVTNQFFNICDTGVKKINSNIDDSTVEVATISADAGNRAMTAAIIFANVIGSNNPATFGLAGFVKMLPYIRYMEINYPPRLDVLLNNMNSTIISFSFGPSISPEVESQFTKYPLPGKFDAYGFHSSFIVNYWQNFGALVIIIIVVIGLSILSTLTRRFATIGYVCRKLTMVVKWNFFLMIFCTNLDGIVLSTSLDLRTIELDSFAAALSFILCLFMNIFTILVFYLIFHIVRDIRISKSRVLPFQHPIPDQKPNPNKKWEAFQSLFIGSKEDFFVQHIFMLPFLLRLYAFNFIIAHLFTQPLFQTILIVLLGVFMLVYMIWKRPFKSGLVFLQHTTDELILLVNNVCIFILACLDRLESESSNFRELLGDIVIIANIVFSITSNIYLVAYLYTGIKAAFAKMKEEKKVGFVSFFIALLAPFESGGMDVEVMAENQRRVVPVMDSNKLKRPEIKKLSIYRDPNPRFNSGIEESRRQSQLLQLQTDITDLEFSAGLLQNSAKNLLRPFERSSFLFPPEPRSSQFLNPKDLLNERVQRRSRRLKSVRESFLNPSTSKLVSSHQNIFEKKDRSETQ